MGVPHGHADPLRGGGAEADTVHLDQSHGPTFLDAEAQLEMYRVLLDRIESIALNVTRSRDLIHNLIRDL
ncbi:Scr1 family TA system antitoxin-like transcriptional regulator [Streptomyces sp. NPDC093510]|uniref:Scr1 family TA system antitoxin-like transcriptional regulator n=1 Tax=Streptomyces sp. NPDC093510 TaxID=3155199 RepID=UPI003448C76D